MLHAQEHAFDVDSLLFAPKLQRHLGHQPADAHAGVVDQHVQPPIAISHRRDDRTPGVFVGHVVMDVEDIAAGGRYRVRDGAARLILNVRQDDGGAFRSQPFGACPANPAGRSRDEGYPAIDQTQVG